MSVLVDVPMWPAHGRLWAHLVSDSSLEELHAFAERARVPARGFDLDHYDVPEERIPALVALGAQQVGAGELTRRLIASGLRVRARDRRRPLVQPSAAAATPRAVASAADGLNQVEGDPPR